MGARYVFLVRFVCARGGWLGGGGSPDGSVIDWAMCGSGSVRGMGAIAWGDALGFMLVGPCAARLVDAYFCTPVLDLASCGGGIPLRVIVRYQKHFLNPEKPKHASAT